MSNFSKWRLPGAAEKFEQMQLERRLNGNQLPMDMPPPRKAAKPPKAKPAKPSRDFIGTTFIGVDPAIRKGGFWMCIICRVDNTATFKTCKHLGEFVRILQDSDPAAVVVENSNLQKRVFNQGSGVGGAIDVGKNMGVSQAAADIADQYSEIPSGVSPKAKGAKIVNESLFQSVVKANGLTLVGYKTGDGHGQDQRDALKLALIAEQQYKLHLKAKKQ
jgi:hypothetical protein